MPRWILLLLLCTPIVIQMTGNNVLVSCADADEDDIEDEGVVEDEGGEGAGAGDGSDDDSENKNVHADADTHLLFTKPKQLFASVVPSSVELPAGQVVEFLVGFTNKAKSGQEFTIESLDASFRYPMDFSYHIQNFSAIAYQKKVKSGHEATVAYSFMPADAFAGRSIGLSVNLAYRDGEGNFYLDPVFNETIQVVDADEGFDPEVFFMYVFMVAGALLVLFLGFTMLSSGKSKGKKPSNAPSRPVETGTAGDDVDYEWIPRSALRTPGSNKTSPRQRNKNSKKAASSGSDSD